MGLPRQSESGRPDGSMRISHLSASGETQGDCRVSTGPWPEGFLTRVKKRPFSQQMLRYSSVFLVHSERTNALPREIQTHMIRNKTFKGGPHFSMVLADASSV